MHRLQILHQRADDKRLLVFGTLVSGAGTLSKVGVDATDDHAKAMIK